MKIDVKVYSPWDTPPDPGIECLDESLTQQHFADQCDINNILADYQNTGVLPEKAGAIYGDFTSYDDFATNFNRLREAQEAFNQLPADLRFKFHNDPALFIDFALNPANLPEMHKMGFTNENYKPVDQAQPAPVTNEPAQGA